MDTTQTPEAPTDTPPAADPVLTPDAPIPTRREEIDAKQAQVAALLQKVQCEGVLLLEPFNLAWFTGAPLADGTPDPATRPALFINHNQRWLACANQDTQYLFDTFLDGLGFQLKEWPWHWGRAQLLADMSVNRKVAVDRPFRDLLAFPDPLRKLRAVLTPAERGRLTELGRTLAHALEATARNIQIGQTEHDVAGQLGHRLLHRGVTPVVLTVAADDRHRRYRRAGVTAAAVGQSCLLGATATRDGLHATASRTVCFGAADATLRQEFDAAYRVQAAQVAAAIPEVLSAAVLTEARRVATMVGQEHEWRLCPSGFLTGWRAVETPLTPAWPEGLHAGSAAVWQAAIGAALVCDTFVTAAPVPECVTPAEAWPVKRIKVGAATVDVPDLLAR